MTDTETETDTEDEIVYTECNEVVLEDGTCWVADPDYLAYDSEADGVIAIQFRDGALWFLDGATRKWMNAEAEANPQKRGLRPVN